MSLEKYELVITALQQRIGELTSSYELQIALLRAELTEMMNAQQQKDTDEKNYEDELMAKLNSQG